MTKDELRKFCEPLAEGTRLRIKKKTIHMGKYGNSTRFRPRNVSYDAVEVTYTHLFQGEYLVCADEGECFYYSKIATIEILK